MENKQEGPPKNEVRVTMRTRVASYLRYVYHTLEKDEENFKTVELKGAGRAIARLVPLVELIKRRIPGLHQTSEISSVMVTDTTRSGEEIERRIVMLKITLSKEPLDTTASGYQEPIPIEEVEEYKEVLEGRDESARGGHRGGRGMLRAGFRGGFRGDRGGFRGGRGGDRGGFRGGMNRGFRGGFRGDRGGFRGERGGFRGQRGGFRGERGGFRGERGGFRGDRGGFRGESRGGFRGDSRGGSRGELRGNFRGGFRGERGGFRGERGGFRGDRGGFRGESRGNFRGQRGSFRGQRGGYNGGDYYNDVEY